MRPNPPRAGKKRLAMLFAAAALAAALGTVLAHGSAAGPARGQATYAASLTPAPEIHGANPEQRALLHQILARLGPTGIDSIQVRARDNTDWIELRSLGIEKPRDYVAPNHVEIAVSYREPSPETSWKALLLAEAFHAESHHRGLPPVVWLSEPSGGMTLTSWDGDVSDDDEDKARAPQPLAADEAVTLEGAARGVAEASGATVERIEVLRPGGHALLLVLRTDDARTFLRERLVPLLDALEPWYWRTAGRYVEVRDQRGWAWSTGQHVSAHGSGGGGGVRPDLECVDPFWRGTTTVPEPPPCGAALGQLRDGKSARSQTP